MTLEEAIKHCEEKAKELREQPFKERMDIEDIADCEECAEEHEQLANWLTELQERREADRWIPVSERMPEPQKPNGDIYNPHYSDYVLVCIEWWNGQKVIDTAGYSFDDEEWVYPGSDESEVIAWKPLPKPYENEDKNAN